MSSIIVYLIEEVKEGVMSSVNKELTATRLRLTSVSHTEGSRFIGKLRTVSVKKLIGNTAILIASDLGTVREGIGRASLGTFVIDLLLW